MKCRKSVSAGKACVESLEVRQFLSASVVSAISAQNLTVGQSAPGLSLGSYFRDNAIPVGDSVVEIKTNLPAPNDLIPLVLTDTATPQTVANFLHYISLGEYTNVLMHRSTAGFVLQGGQFYADGTPVNGLGAIPSEASTATLHNTAGTISAVLSSSPDSAEAGFFFNLVSNDGTGTTPNLNAASDGGPFTTFGKVIYNGISALNGIAALSTVDASSTNISWGALPVQNATLNTPTTEPASNLVVLNPEIIPGGLTYTVSSQNSSVATPSIVNGQLLLTAGSAAGSTKITVVATDLGGGTAKQTFVVKQENRPAAGGGISMALASPLPSSLIAGSSLPNNFRIRFANSTFDGVQGSVAAAIVLSTSNQVVDPVATLASTSFELNLKYRGSRTVKLSSAPAVPSSVPAGTYHVMLEDGWGVGLSYDTGKTITVKAPTVDLAGALTRTPAAATAGKRTSVTFTISNALSASVAAGGLLPYQIEASPDGLLSDATIIATGKKKIAINPGKHLSISMPITLKQTGSEKLILVIDPSNAVFPDDSNAANNIVVATTATNVK